MIGLTLALFTLCIKGVVQPKTTIFSLTPSCRSTPVFCYLFS